MYINTAVALITTLLLANVNAEKLLRVPVTRISRPDPIIAANQLKSGLAKRDPFTASLYNDAGSQYLVEVSVGTPAQNFSVTLDTGSADLWIPGSSCPTSECPNGGFKESQSSTFKSLDEAFTLVYGIGNVNGTYVTDTVAVSGATVQNQQFGLASTTQQILTNPNTITVSEAAKTNDTLHLKSLAASNTVVANGILGLGFPKLTAASSKGQGVYNPFVFNLVANDIITDPVFSIYLNKATSYGWVGEIIFGGVDESKYTGNITYLPLASLSSTKSKRATLPNNSNYYYWMVQGDGIAVTNGSTSSNTASNSNSSNNSSSTVIDINFSSSSAFILDTGTTLTYLPTNMAKQVVEAFAGQDYSTDSSSGAYIVSCDAAKSPLQFVLKLTTSDSANPVTLSVPASELVIPLDASSADAATYCLFGIAPNSGSSIGNNLYLVGDSVLRSTYVVYDMGNSRVGLAVANGVNGAVQGVSSSSTSSAMTIQPQSAMFALLACLLAAMAAF